MSMSVQHASGVSNIGKVGQMAPEGDDMMAKIKMLLEELFKMLAKDSRKPGEDQSAGDSGSGGCKGAGGSGKVGSAPPAGSAGGGSAPAGGSGKGGASGGGSAGQATGSQSTPSDLPSDKKGTIDRAEQDINDKYGRFMQSGEKDKAQFQIADPGAGNAGVTYIGHDGQADQIKLGGDLKGSDLYHVAGHEKAHASMSKEFEAAFNGKSGEMSAIEGGAEMLANSATPEKGFKNEYYTKGYVGNAEKAREMVGDETFSKAFFGGDAASIKQVQQAFNSMGAT